MKAIEFTKAEKFLGMSKHKAQDTAEAMNMLFHLIRIGEKDFNSYPKDEDKRDDRICVELDNGQVVKAIIK